MSFFKQVVAYIISVRQQLYLIGLIKNSQFQYISSLFKIRQFNDAVESLTIFVDKKHDSKMLENIFIQDDGKILSEAGEASSTIFAESGYVSDNEKNLVLYNGSIQTLKADNKINIIKFKKTVLNLSGISTKSIVEAKMQETSTMNILLCIQNKNVSMHNCDSSKKSLMDQKIEINITRKTTIKLFIYLNFYVPKFYRMTFRL